MEDNNSSNNENVTPAAVNPPESIAPTLKNNPPIDPVVNKSPKKLFMICGIVFLLAIAGAIAFYLSQDKKKPAPVQNTQETTKPTTLPEQKPISKTQEEELLEKFITPTTGETWLTQPKKLPAQGFYQYGEAETEYYEVGKHGSSTILMSVVSQIGDEIRLYEKNPGGKVSIIAQPDGDAVYNEDNSLYKDSLVKTIAIDTTTHYDSLTLPRKIDLGKGVVISKPNYPALGDFIRPDEGPKTTKYIEEKKLGLSAIKRVENSYADTQLTSIGYRLETPLNTTIHLAYEPLEVNLKDYQWQRGAFSDDKITAVSRGCGGFYSSVTRGDVMKDSDFVEVGKSSSGKMVYEAKSVDNPLMKKAYEEYIEFVKDAPAEKYAGITKANFVKEHAVVFFKDSLGQWLVYVRDELRPAYGCAKPVVYLYPTTEQHVSVKVGADVKISDPLYNNKTGWSVWARPNGQLTVNGQAYNSLFWEGPGHGQYPSITNGTIVARDQALSVIKQHLGQLGLNAKESADFVDYWQDKLPSKPYVRLTWLTTTELNKLAPLYVTPKPDTVIRVFLDYSGLDAPIALPAQSLSTIPRKGFTVIEWGGLSPTKLY